MPVKTFLADLLRPALHLLPTGRHRVLRLIGAGNREDSSWNNLPSRFRVFYDRRIHAYFWADLADWGCRWHYYCGYYYDPINQRLICHALRSGDTFIDIGANYGVHSMLAARCVGAAGRIYCFEPNPATFDVLKAHIVMNAVRNAHLFQMGLSDAAGQMTLSGQDHVGMFTLRAVQGNANAFQVPIHIGDDLLKDCPDSGKILVKIDTEGFEHHVLKGLRQFRKRLNAAYSVEITDDWLRQTGSSAQELFDDMRADGYLAFHARLKHPRLKKGLILDPVQKPLPGQHDLFFMRPGFCPLAG